MIAPISILCIVTLCLSSTITLQNVQASGGSKEFLQLVTYYEIQFVPHQKKILNQAKQDVDSWKIRSAEKMKEIYDFDQAIWDSFQQQSLIIAYQDIIDGMNRLLAYYKDLPKIKQNQRNEARKLKYNPNVIIPNSISNQEKEQALRWQQAIKKAQIILQKELENYQSQYKKVLSQFQFRRAINNNATKLSKINFSKLKSKAINSSEQKYVQKIARQAMQSNDQYIRKQFLWFAQQLRKMDEKIFKKKISMEDYLKTKQWAFNQKVTGVVIYQQVYTNILGLAKRMNQSALTSYNQAIKLLNNWEVVSTKNFQGTRLQAQKDGKNASGLMRLFFSLVDADHVLKILLILVNSNIDTNNKAAIEMYNKMSAQERKNVDIRNQMMIQIAQQKLRQGLNMLMDNNRK